YSSHNQPPHKQHLPQPLLIYFNHTSPNRTYTLSLHDALPILQLVSDEIYHGLSYTGQLHTAWEFSREAIVVNSFSKYWCMTGWRLGWMLVPERLRRAVDTLTGNFTLCPPALSQHAALAAFTPEAYAEVAEHVARYRENRELLLRGLAELGITRVAPADGAFYVWADISEFTDD